MKKAIVFSMAALFAVSVVSGHVPNTDKRTDRYSKGAKTERVALKTMNGRDISPLSKISFESDFGTVSNAQWEKGSMYDEVTFTKDGRTLTAYYDLDARLVGTTEVSSFEKLPARGQEAINSKYNDYKVTNVLLFDGNEMNDNDMYLFGTPFDSDNNFFVELVKQQQKIVLKVDTKGKVEFFTRMQ